MKDQQTEMREQCKINISEFSDASYMSLWQIIHELWKELWQSTVCVSFLQSSVTVICKSFARLVGRLTVKSAVLGSWPAFPWKLPQICAFIRKLCSFLWQAPLIALFCQLAWKQTHTFTDIHLTSAPNFSLQGRKISAAEGLRTERPIELLVTAHTFIFCVRNPSKMLTVRAKQSTTTFS